MKVISAICMCFQIPSQAASANAKKLLENRAELSSALVELQWSSRLHGFEGVQYVILPRSQLINAAHSSAERLAPEIALDFWALPNRDLQSHKQQILTREQHEFIQSSAAAEWPFEEKGLGAVTVRRVDMAEGGEFCSGSHAGASRWDDAVQWSSQIIERRDSERHLRVIVQPKHSSVCVALRISFEFFPREGIGNFAMQRDASGTFSGPVHLLFKPHPLPTTLRFRDRDEQLILSCVGCLEGKDGWTEVSFESLPPVLEFRRKDTPEQSVTLVGTSTLEVKEIPKGEKSASIAHAVVEMSKAFELAINKLHQKTGAVWTLKVRPRILIERLIIGQPWEVQLGPAYGEFGFFLDSFQQAALFREVSRNFLRHAFRHLPNQKMETWAHLEERERWLRIIAELWVTHFYPDISKIKTLAGRFSFLPFFRDLESGKALLNNNIFMGKEETGRGPDFSFSDEFFDPMTGSELILRMRTCMLPDDFEGLVQSAVEIAQGKSAISDFIEYVFSKRPTSECTSRLLKGIFPQDVVPESIRLDSSSDGITLTRQIDDIPASKKFFLLSGSAYVRQKIELEIEEASGVQRLRLPELTDDKKYVHTLFGRERKKPQRVSVLLPIRSSRTDRFVWPRPIKFSLQSIAMSYDSRQDDISLKSQASFFQEGDDWNKTVALGFRRAFSTNQLNFQFTSSVPSLLSQFASSLSLQSNIELTKDNPTYLTLTFDSSNARTGQLYPEGLSFQGNLRRPISLSAFTKPMTDPNQEFTFSYALGLAPRLTWRETLTYGASDLGLDVGLRDLPAWPQEEFVSREYGLVRSEIFHTLAHNEVVPLLRTVIFQHALVYAAHVLAFDALEPLEETNVGGRTAQSVSAGVRLFGALLGAKNQSLSFEVARGLSTVPKTSYSFTVGRSIN